MDAVQDLKNKVRSFSMYNLRAETLEEVLDDQSLLVEEPPWNLNMIVDFHQIYELAFPPLAKVEVKIEEKGSQRRVVMKLTPPRPEDKSRIFSNRLRKAIPFFGTIRIKAPVLIPPYKRELEWTLESLMEQLLRSKLRDYLKFIVQDVPKLREEWSKSIEDLRERDDPHTLRRWDAREVQKFAELMVEGFYFLSFTGAIGSEIINHLLSDTMPKPHIRRLEPAKEALIKEISMEPWIDLLDSIRNKPFSNIIDAQAIAMVLKLNELACRDSKRELYFLLSDSSALRQLLSRSGARHGLPSGYSPPLVKHPLFPKALQSQGVSILRTSDHFEEFLRAFDSALPAQIDNLKLRKENILSKIRINSSAIDEVSRKCTVNNAVCPCEIRDKCTLLRDSIGSFLAGDELILNLKNVIMKEQLFEPLLTFMKRYLEADIAPELAELCESYTAFFLEDFDQTVIDRLGDALSRYERAYTENIFSLSKAGIDIADRSVATAKTRLGRMRGILYEITFSENETIKSLLLQLADEGYQQLEMVRSWYTEIIRANIQHRDDVEASLLSLILLYCNGFYDECSWLALFWIDSRFDQIIKANKAVEFNYLLASSEARIQYFEQDKKAAGERIDQIVKKLDELMADADHGTDARLPHLAGKILGRKHFFGVETTDSILLRAIDYFRKALQMIESMKGAKAEVFKSLVSPLKNNILYSIARLVNPRVEMVREAEGLYAELSPQHRTTHYTETFAWYHYMLSMLSYEKDREKSAQLMFEALRELVWALILGKTESANEQELSISSRQLNEWISKYHEMFNDPLIHSKVKELWGDAERRIARASYDGDIGVASTRAWRARP
jgi:hypothetical protein